MVLWWDACFSTHGLGFRTGAIGANSFPSCAAYIKTSVTADFNDDPECVLWDIFHLSIRFLFRITPLAKATASAFKNHTIPLSAASNFALKNSQNCAINFVEKHQKLCKNVRRLGENKGLESNVSFILKIGIIPLWNQTIMEVRKSLSLCSFLAGKIHLLNFICCFCSGPPNRCFLISRLDEKFLRNLPFSWNIRNLLYP